MKICRETTKVSQPSRGAAVAQLRSIKKVEPEYKGDVYPCPYCAGWHVGRPRKNSHKNKYSPRWSSPSTDNRHNVIEIE